MTDRTGKQLGNYRLLRLLGHGGFADVYLGEHLYLKTPAAIKILHTHLASDESQRFLQEARMIANLAHPHIVRVLDFGIEDSVPFLIMEYAPQGTLRQRYPRDSRLPLTNIVAYVKQAANALQHAHEMKLIHRDVKPENMLLNQQNDVLLSDFGLALVMESSHYQSSQEVVGTAAYMAPEQLQGKPQPASDQYALGVTVYEWLSGERPFRGSFTEVASQHIYATPPPLREKVPDLAPDIEEVVLIALSKDPQRRFGRIQSFAIALEQACQLTGSAQPIMLTLQDEASDVPTRFNPAMKRQQVLEPQETIPIPEEHQLPVEHQQSGGRVSRRTMLLGAGVGLVAAGGGLAWFALSRVLVPPKPPLPAGVINIYRGHTLDVYTAVWSPDGKRIVSCSADHTAQVWDAMTGDQPLVYSSHTNEVNIVAWWSQARLIASGSRDKTVRVWESATGNTTVIYDGHTDIVNALAWAPAGSRIASGAYDKTVQIWDGVTREKFLTYRGHTDWVLSVDWSPDGKRIASASKDKTVQIWDAATGAHLLTYSKHGSSVSTVMWSHDGKYIASGSDEDGKVHVWDPTNGTTHTIYQGHAQGVWTVAWSRDNQLIASGGKDHTVQIWKALTGLNVFTYRHHTATVWNTLWSPDGKSIASASSDKTVQIWQSPQ